MGKKQIYLIVIIILVAILSGFLIFNNIYKKPILNNISLPETLSEKDQVLFMGAGWSSQLDEVAAVEEAVAMMESKLKDKKANFVIVSSESGYDNQKISQALNNSLENQAKIYGWTSFRNTATNQGMQRFALLGFASEKLSAGVGGCSFDEVNYPGEKGSREQVYNAVYQATDKAIERALLDAGKTKQEKPQIVLVSGATYLLPGTLTNPIEERYIEAIGKWFGNDVSIVGGLAGDTMAKGNEKVFVNKDVLGYGSLSIALIYSDVKISVANPEINIGYAYLGGFTPSVHKGVITKADGHLIYEIDNKPCRDVYDEWTEKGLGERINASDWVIDYTALHTLAEKIVSPDGAPVFYNKLIHYFNNPEQGVCKTACEVKKGEEIYLLHGTTEMFVERGALTARLARAQGKINSDEIAGGYMIFCAGSFLAIPQDDYPAITDKINQALDGADFIGGYEFGGFGSFLGERQNVFSTQMTSFLVFSKY